MALLNKPITIDEPTAYPKTEREARKLIEDTFWELDWSFRDSEVYLKGIGITTAPDKLDRDEMKKVLAEMAKDRMIIFAV